MMEIEKITEENTMGLSVYVGSIDEVNKYVSSNKKLYIKDFDIVAPRTDIKIVAHLSKKTNVLDVLIDQKLEMSNYIPEYISERKEQESICVPAMVRGFAVRQEVKIVVLFNTYKYGVKSEKIKQEDLQEKPKIEEQKQPEQDKQSDQTNNEQKQSEDQKSDQVNNEQKQSEQDKQSDQTKPGSITEAMDKMLHGGQHVSSSGYYDAGKKKRK